MNQTRPAMLALAALQLTFTLSTTAFADTAQLRYKDLDLTTDAGKAELAQRIDATARAACPAEAVTGTRLLNLSEQRRCIADATRQIQDQLASRTGMKSYGR